MLFRDKDKKLSDNRNGTVCFKFLFGAGLRGFPFALDIWPRYGVPTDSLSLSEGLKAHVAKLTVEDFPCIVVIDSEGNNFYKMGQKPYRKL